MYVLPLLNQEGLFARLFICVVVGLEFPGCLLSLGAIGG
jgi:hypothetical protein